MTLEDGLHELPAGAACFIFPNRTHSIDRQGEAVAYDVIKLDVNQYRGGPSYAPPMNLMMKEAGRQGMPGLLSPDEVAELGLAPLVAECVRQEKEHQYGYDLIIRCLLYMLMTMLVRHWMKMGFSVQPRVLNSQLYGAIDSVTAYIESHLRGTLRVEQLAEHCGMSYPTFARRFR